MIKNLLKTHNCRYTCNRNLSYRTIDGQITAQQDGVWDAVILTFAEGGMCPLYFAAFDVAKSSLNGTYGTIVGYEDGTLRGTANYLALTMSNQYMLDDTDATATSVNNKVVAIYDMLYGAGHTGAQVYARLQELYGPYKTFGLNVPTAETASDPGLGSYNIYFPGQIVSLHTTTYASLSTINGNTCDFGTCRGYYKATYANTDHMDITGYDYQLDPQIEIDTMGKLYAWIIFEDNPLEEKLIFDVYVDGVIGGKGPNIAIKFRNNDDDSALSPELIHPHIYIWPGVPENPLHEVEGIIEPDSEKMGFEQWFDFTGEYSADYIGQSKDIINHFGYNTLQQVLYFGADCIPDVLHYYMRFDYQTLDGYTWGDLWRVDIPYVYEGAVYIEKMEVPGSSNSPLFDTEVNIIGGAPPEDPEDDPDEPEQGEDPEGDPSDIGPYVPGYDPIDWSESEPEGFDGNAILTRTYCMTGSTLQNVGTKLWSQSYFDVLKIQNNPIENIIAVKWMPFSDVSATPSDEIQVGDVNFGIYADDVSYIKVIPFTSSYKHVPTDDFPGYLSCSPYCTIKLHLPYVGTVQLDATEMLNRTLNGKYVVDIITGDILVILTLNGAPYMNISGKMGVDIPLTATNRSQTELASASRALSATIGAAAHVAGGDMLGGAESAASGIMSVMGMDYSSQRTATHSPACATYEDRSVYLELSYSLARKSAGFTNQHGHPAHLYKKLTKGQGFVKIDRRAVINVAMTREENDMLQSILTSGFYV